LAILDYPDGNKKLHKGAIPLLGGGAIFIAFFVVACFFRDHILLGNLETSHLWGVFAGALIIMIGGLLDDKFNLSPIKQIIFPILAVLAVIIGGVGIEKITNPFGSYVYLPFMVSAIFIALWLLGMMYTTKLLDGVDGLVTGVSLIASVVIFFFTLTTKYYQPDMALVAAIFSGALLGFLIFNFPKAKIFLGEGGSLLAGFILGVLAIISGGKIAIALLVMGLPIMDVLVTIIRRILRGKNPFRFADRGHLHHKLLDSGLSPLKTILVFYGFAIIFGGAALFLQSRGKLWALLLLALLMLLLVLFLSYHRKLRLLLHTCCAPCAAYTAVNILAKKYLVTLYYCNPNIDSEEEWEKRLVAVRSLADKFNFPLIVEPYKPEEFLAIAAGKESLPEGGARCLSCYQQRLKYTADLAKKSNFDFFTTSLTVSPYKNSEIIIAIGKALSPKFLSLDFKNDDGYKKSNSFAKEQGYYRQNYCACVYSRRD
jgi:UDP-GlcNAc:undecaprenyl-phosphate GlcNAc-1-phosphate transferase